MSENLRVIEFSKYTQPKKIEDKTNGWVSNGPKNKFAYDLIEIYKGSPTHSTIVNSFASMMYGNGLKAKNSQSRIQDWAAVRRVLKTEDLRAMILDYLIHGAYSFQVIKSKRGELGSICHIPYEKIVPSVKDGKTNHINSYWYIDDWKKTVTGEKYELPVFSGKNDHEIYVYKRYSVGNDYFSEPVYMSGMQYAQLELEISNFYISHIKNGLSFGYVINVPNGATLTDSQKDKIEADIKEKLTGSSNAGRFILNFQVDDLKITVEVIQINDAHKQWQYLTTEARQQLFTSHGVVSPILFGIKDNTGFGNNANELAEARQQTIDYVINPKRDEFLKPIEEVLFRYGLAVDLYFGDLGGKKIETEEHNTRLSIEGGEILNAFIEAADDEDELRKNYDVVGTQDVDDYEAEERIHLQLASTGVARPNAKSVQDFDTHLIRYKYVGSPVNENTREFCRKMLQSGKVYRKEDIEQLTNKPVNKGFGENGAATYSIWLYKGGARCKHKWQRVVYLKKGRKIDAKSPLATIISTSEARRRGLEIPSNDNKVSVIPYNMKNRGFVNPPSKKDIQSGI